MPIKRQPRLDGDAAVGDVVTTKTFYNTDPFSKQTGSLVISDTAAVGDVRDTKTFHNEPYTQRTGTADLSEHQNSEATDVGANTTGVSCYYDTVANGNTIVSQSITTTSRCLIVVVTTMIEGDAGQVTQIQRGGVDKTVETTISANNFAVTNGRGHLQYATEVLAAGSYTYALVNSSGVDQYPAGATMKIVAVTF